MILRIRGPLVLGTVAAALLVSSVQAAPLVQETFTYPDGNLVGRDPPIGGIWATHSGTTGPVQVIGGAANIVQTSPNVTEDVNVPFEGGFAAGAGTVLYAGFDLTVPVTTNTIISGYFAHFLEGTSTFDARVWITTPTTSGFRLALSNDNSITDGDGEVFSTDLSFDTTYRIHVRYDYDAMSARMWINPVDETSAFLAATDPGFSDEVTAFALRQFSPAATGGTTQIVDNLFIGTTFADSVVPEPATLGLLALAGVGLLRRR